MTCGRPAAGHAATEWLAAAGDRLRRHRGAIVALQWIVVLAYAILLVVPALLALPPERAGLFDHLTRLAQFVFWGIWWPFVIVSVIAFGRAWCGFLCPEGALTEWASRHGAGRRMPRWLKWGGWPFVAFVSTTVYGQLVSVYEYPKPALVVLGGSTLAAVGVGLLYGRGTRLWCRHLCPVSGVFAILARLAPVHFRVDRAAWARSDSRPEPIRCAPLVHIKSMTGAADCHMCARCSGHKDAIRLALRSPGREIVETASSAAPAWQARLLVWGMLGVATGAFQWSASPWLVAAKQGIATWLVERELFALLADGGRWWLLTHYPEASDVFSWLDGALILAYIAVTALVLGGWAAAWLYAGEKLLRVPHARRALALTLTPFAGLAIFLGLFAMTATQLAAEGLALAWLPALRALVLGAGIAWSAALATQWIRRQPTSLARRAAATAATLAASVLPVCAWVIQFAVW
jgi:polyferredoxin